MFGLHKLRNKLDSVAQNRLHEHDGDLLLLKRNGEEATLVSASIDQTAYHWGIFPLYKVGERGYTRLSVSIDIVKPIRMIFQSLRNAIKKHSEATWKMVIQSMADSLTKMVESVRKEWPVPRILYIPVLRLESMEYIQIYGNTRKP